MTEPLTIGRSPGPDITIDGVVGELLAAVWCQGQLRSRVLVSPIELRRSRGHGLELFRDRDGVWSLIVVHHPWTEPPTRTLTLTCGGHAVIMPEPATPGLVHESKDIPPTAVALRDAYGNVWRHDPQSTTDLSGSWVCAGTIERCSTEDLLRYGAPLTVVEHTPPHDPSGVPLPFPEES